MNFTSPTIPGSSITDEQWQELLGAYPAPMTLETQPDWWFSITCTDCNKLLHLCKHYPVKHKTALEWQAELLTKNQEVVPLVPDEFGNIPEPAYLTPTGRKPKGSVLREVPESLYETILAEFDEVGGMVALSQKFNIQPPVMKEFLVKNGREVKKGRAKGSVLTPKVLKDGEEAPKGHFGRVRSTLLELSSEQIAEAVEAFKNGQGSTALAKDYNVPQPLMKQYLEAAGCVLKRGKRKKEDVIISLGGSVRESVPQ